jgi:crossover junction endodeoxyribonuclease RuvC
VIVLGIDPGTAATGWGIVERNGNKLRLIDYGCFETVPADDLPVRLFHIHQAMTELIAEHKPALVGVERLFFNKNVQTAFAVGQARGVVLLAAAQAGVPVHEFGPHEVKIAVTGYGRAGKDQVQRMVQALLGMAVLPRPDDAADALAVAICSAHTERLKPAHQGVQPVPTI